MSHTWSSLQSWGHYCRQQEVCDHLIRFAVSLLATLRCPRCCRIWYDDWWLTYTPPVVTVRRELHSDCLALLQTPHIQEEAQLKLPLDINNYPFYRYVQIYFRVRPIMLKMKPPPKKKTILFNNYKINLKFLFGVIFSCASTKSQNSFIAPGTKVWDADGNAKVTSDAPGGCSVQGGLRALQHGGLTV